eukprot:m51a1_g13942 putative seven transmembrane domain protein (232) ;mRNA; f:883326-884342
MTFVHLLNCLALTFAPIVITYKASKLADSRSLFLLINGFVGYFGAQFVKLMVMGMLVPTTGVDSFDSALELLKGVMGAFDVLGMQLALTLFASGRYGNWRVVGVALGWAFAESFGTRLAPLWMYARGSEWDWSNLRMCLEANLSLGLALCSCCLVWANREWTRRAQQRRMARFAMACALTIAVALPPAEAFALHLTGVALAPAAVRAAGLAAAAVVAMRVYRALNATQKEK